MVKIIRLERTTAEQPQTDRKDTSGTRSDCSGPRD